MKKSQRLAPTWRWRSGCLRNDQLVAALPSDHERLNPRAHRVVRVRVPHPTVCARRGADTALESVGGDIMHTFHRNAFRSTGGVVWYKGQRDVGGSGVEFNRRRQHAADDDISANDRVTFPEKAGFVL